jgi:hypothetical protein
LPRLRAGNDARPGRFQNFGALSPMPQRLRVIGAGEHEIVNLRKIAITWSSEHP